MVVNALHNSIDAIREHGSHGEPLVEIVASVKGEMMTVRVLDNGPGVDAALLSQNGMFCIGQTTKPEGHGIGLQLCYDVAQRLGGTLTLSNRPEGGAVLTLTAPVQRVREMEGSDEHE